MNAQHWNVEGNRMCNCSSFVASKRHFSIGVHLFPSRPLEIFLFRSALVIKSRKNWEWHQKRNKKLNETKKILQTESKVEDRHAARYETEARIKKHFLGGNILNWFRLSAKLLVIMTLRRWPVQIFLLHFNFSSIFIADSRSAVAALPGQRKCKSFVWNSRPERRFDLLDFNFPRFHSDLNTLKAVTWNF